RTNPGGRQARRPAGRTADQDRVGHQCRDRPGARPCHSAGNPRPRRRGDRMRRRAIVATLAFAATSGARAARSADVPVVGFLSNRTREQGRYLVAAVRRGLQEMGFVEGDTVTIDFRWSGGDISQLPALAKELVNRPVAVLIGGGTPQAAKAATTTIPVV